MVRLRELEGERGGEFGNEGDLSAEGEAVVGGEAEFAFGLHFHWARGAGFGDLG